MKFAKGLAQHTIVVVVAKRERGAALKTLLGKLGYRVHVTTSLYDALTVISQDMPAMVISESVVSDGNAGNLHDRLMQHPILKETPILVNVLRKTREELAPLKGRKFVGFILGSMDPKTLLAKVSELMGAHSAVSPHFVSADRLTFKKDVMVAIDATVVGRKGDQVVVRSETEVDPQAALLCVPKAGSNLAPAVLRNATNLKEGEQQFNLFPMNRIVGKGRQWLESLPDLNAGSGAPAPQTKPIRRVLFFEPNQKRFDGFNEILKGYGFELIHAKSISMAASFIKRDPDQYKCVYLHELTNDAGGIEWKKTFAGLSPSQRPALIVGTSSQNIRSTHEIRYIKRPFGLGVFVELLESCFESAAEVAAVAGTESSTGGAGTAIRYQAQAKLLGLDEIGGVLQIKFPVHKQSRLAIEHEFLDQAWGGDTVVTIEAAAQAPAVAGTYQIRFSHLPAGMSKAKYWEKISAELKPYLTKDGISGIDSSPSQEKSSA